MKVLEFLKPFSKGFKWVWAKPTVFVVRGKAHDLYVRIVFVIASADRSLGRRWGMPWAAQKADSLGSSEAGEIARDGTPRE